MANYRGNHRCPVGREREVWSAGCRTLTFKLFGHQQHGEVLIDASQPAAVNLEKLQGFGLEELLKHHSIVALETECQYDQPWPSGSANLATPQFQVTHQ